MSRRSQSDVVGVVLLTAVITVTVVGAGGITLIEWQSDIGSEPTVDIESELTLDRVELEHFGGDQLPPSETVVLLDDNEVAIPLEEFEGVDDQFTGGMRVSNSSFEPVAGDVSLRVVHQPSETIIHDETYRLQFLLLVEGTTGPVFMFEEPPINYTADTNAELTLSDATVVDLDSEDSTISSLRTGTTTISAVDGSKKQTTTLSVIELGTLGIETVDANATGLDSIELASELTALDPLDETDLYMRYRQQQPVEFNEDPTNNSDDVIAHGTFESDPDGYTHADKWIHDNTPLVPGATRSYEYFATSQPSYLVATLREEPELTETRDGDSFELDELVGDYYFLDDGNNIPNSGPFNITVEYTDDGETVNVYVEGALEQTWTSGIATYDELYFSTRGEDNSLRLLSSPTLGTPQYGRVASGIDSPTVDTSLFAGVQPDSVYFVESYAERDIANGVVNATGKTLAVETDKLVETRPPTAVDAESVRLRGELLRSPGDTDLSFVVEDSNGTVVANPSGPTAVGSNQLFNTTVDELEPNSSYVYYARAEDTSTAGTPISDIGAKIAFTTDEPEIQTVDRRATGPSRIEVDGNLTTIAGLGKMNRSIYYRQQQPVEFNEDPTDNGDEVIAHGTFESDPDGYTHDNRWIHDNTPLVPGTNRSYNYVAMSQPQYLVATLRAEPELTETRDGDSFELDELVGDYYFLDDGNNIPTNGPFNVTIKYTDDGETVNVYVEGTLEQTWTSGVSNHHALYFSTRGEDNSLRLGSSPTLGEWQTGTTRTTDSATKFTDPVVGLQPDTVYFVRTYAEQEVDGQTINATGETLAVETDKLVETRAPTAVGAERVKLEGELLNTLGDTDLSFVVETADGTVVRNTTVATGIDSQQAFSATVEGLEPNSSYVYHARAEDTATTGTPISDIGAKIAFTTDEPEIQTVDRRATGRSSIEVDGNLTNIAGLEQMDRYVRYRSQQPVEFNEDPANNSDDVIAHGTFESNPDGYTHDNRWIHDNTPLVPGATRSYEYTAMSQPGYLVATLREEPELTETRDGDAFELDELVGDYYFLDDGNNIPTNGPFNVTVKYTDDGGAVNVYVEGALEQTWTSGIATYDELYFSTRGEDNSLRLGSSPTLSEPQLEFIETTDSPTNFTDPVVGLQADTFYFVETYAERTVNGQTINATGETLAVETEKLVETRTPTAIGAESVRLRGELLNSLGDTDISFVVETPDGTVVRTTTVGTGLTSQQAFNTTVEGLEPNRSYVYYARAEESGGVAQTTDVGKAISFTTDEPEIQTVDRRATGPSSIEVDGNLTNIAGLEEMNRYVRYWQQQPAEFNEDPTDNGDEVIAHGSFEYDPDGYTHDNRWIHDNTPLVPGATRSYEYVAMSQPQYLVATLREEPELSETRDGDAFELDELVGDYYFLDDKGTIPTNGPFNVTVEYTDDGGAVNVYVEGALEQTWTSGIADYDELYFSTRGDDNSLRLASSPTLGDLQLTFIETTDSETSFTDPVSGLQPDTLYFVEAYAERTVNGQTINATGETLAVETDKLVETRAPTAVGAESVQLEGELLNSLGDTDLSFVVETPDGTEVRNTTVATGLTSQQAFNTTVEGLEPNRSYVYYARAEDSGGAVQTTDVGETTSFTTDEPEIQTVDRRATGPNSIEVDGNLTDLGGLKEMDRYVRYRQQQPVEFNEDPTNNSDDVIAHGTFEYNPDGYTHDNRWIHDNTPLVPGSNRSYEYVAMSQPSYLVATLREEPELTETRDGDAFELDELVGDYYFLDDGNNIPTNGPFNVTVEYTDDGETVNVYVEGALEQTWTSGIADYDELYFSTRGEDNSLRVASSPTLGEPQLAFIETTDSSTNFSDSVTGLQPATFYFVEAYAEQTVNGQTINTTGETLAAETDDS